MSSSAQPSSLLLFTSSQAPLPTRYPHPHKPRFVIPPLVHRTLHNALDAKPADGSDSNGDTSAPGFQVDQGCLILPHPDSMVKHDLPPSSRTPTPPSEAVNHADTNVVNDAVHSEGDMELTLKLHLVGSSSAEERTRWVDEALSTLSTYKGLGAGSVDTLLVGWKGVDYKGKKTAVSEFFGCGAEGLEGGGGAEASEEVEEEVRDSWGRIVEALKGEGEQRVKRLGTMYLPLGVLQRLTTGNGKVQKPEINMLDTPDCHHLPKEYSGFAKEHAVELWAGGGGEGADPLPDAELHNLLQEFASPLGLKSISDLIPLRADQLKYDLASPSSVQPGVQVKWVLGYTVLSKARNVVKDRGYVISATL
ncbi:uncharacterized protein MKK02DRAFT_28223 [Dioszegia hungarica]|uniref:Uncharacterized protein n=1 Tax=Dioszegia hungarica TaxID=4972 RepID=A0AA38LT85_9TREE|nr:uncharacterized protein MKK02DRAFT_28223 [Dioszegia hungarica]KAI9634485.1 hypothetical protein MKK02DRAFT_28223 [Dioszegia hungarica]